MNRSQRRALAKKRRRENQLNRAANLSTEWRLGGRSYPRPPKEPQVPGLNCPPVDEEYAARVDRNHWHDRPELQTFIAKILELSGNETLSDSSWSWARNSACKYVDIRIDMRDGGFILVNRHGQRINLAQLEWQYQSIKTKEGQ